MKISRLILSFFLACVLVCLSATQVLAFCGFYVAGADAKLFNKSSQVIIARNGENTILTMANDYDGDIKDFALVVPVPTAIKKEQVNVGKKAIVEKLDKFSQPRLVEYFDPDPCRKVYYDSMERTPIPLAAPAPSINSLKRERELGVTIEDKFKVNEYEILILSAKESDGLEIWLQENNYKIPSGASELLKPYIKQGMKFFVAKIDLKEFEKSGDKFLRPLQIAYSSPKFMLPIRLGMVNSRGEQDLIVYILSPKGQVELTNYRTVKVPTDKEIPVFVKKEFGPFYQSLFQTAYERENKKVGFLEYAWSTNDCDPCSTEPPTRQELKEAGVFWLDNPSGERDNLPPNIRRRPVPVSSDVFITRLHVRYGRNEFPEDLIFQETSNRQNFQGRYIMNHPFTKETTCDAGIAYKRSLKPRLEKEAQNLASLTGWNIDDIRKKIDFGIANVPRYPRDNTNFWQNIWR